MPGLHAATPTRKSRGTHCASYTVISVLYNSPFISLVLSSRHIISAASRARLLFFAITMKANKSLGGSARQWGGLVVSGFPIRVPTKHRLCRASRSAQCPYKLQNYGNRLGKDKSWPTRKFITEPIRGLRRLVLLLAHFYISFARVDG